MSAHNWNTAQDMSTWMRHMEKRVMSQERRPVVSEAADLLGPGAGPYAVHISDWNDEATTFNGTYFSDPADGQINSPNDAWCWMGETFGTEEGFGWQRLTRYKLDPSNPPGTGSWDQYRRRFFPISDSGDLYFSAWEAF